MTDEAWPKLQLSPIDARKWSETRTATLWSQPAFSDIWYNLMIDKDGTQAYFTDKTPGGCAATNGKYMYINPADFFKSERNLNHRVFITCHEIMHAILDDPRVGAKLIRAGKVTYPDGKVIPIDETRLQKAADYRINAILVESKVGELPPDGLHDPSLVTHEDTLLGAYRKLYEDEQRSGKGNGKPGAGGGTSKSNGPGDGKPDKNFDSHMKPGEGEGKDEHQAEGERNEQEWATGVAAAIHSAKLMGKLPAALERALGKLLEPEIDWTEKLRTMLARRLGNSASTWNKLDENLLVRGIGAPGRVGFGAGCVYVAVDTSASITQEMMDRFMAETGGILDDVKPKRLVLLQCDAHVHEVVECDDVADLYRRKLKGGGGTSFIPVFERIEQDGDPIDTLIYFTDLLGSFPAQAPGYPVIWASINPGYKPPWGDLVDVPLRKGS
jgi:predicted metal-dependent peptidase